MQVMIISIAGPPGSGKSTVALQLAIRLHYKRYYMGGIMRDLARKRNMTIEEYNDFCKKNKSADEELDEYQRRLGRDSDEFIIEGRTSFHFIPTSIKIYLTVSLEEAAKRISGDVNSERNEQIVASLEEKEQIIADRIENESTRYKEHYGIDVHDTKNFDIVIDTTFLNPEEVVEQILSELPSK